VVDVVLAGVPAGEARRASRQGSSSASFTRSRAVFSFMTPPSSRSRQPARAKAAWTRAPSAPARRLVGPHLRGWSGWPGASAAEELGSPLTACGVVPCSPWSAAAPMGGSYPYGPPGIELGSSTPPWAVPGLRPRGVARGAWRARPRASAGAWGPHRGPRALCAGGPPLNQYRQSPRACQLVRKVPTTGSFAQAWFAAEWLRRRPGRAGRRALRGPGTSQADGIRNLARRPLARCGRRGRLVVHNRGMEPSPGPTVLGVLSRTRPRHARMLHRVDNGRARSSRLNRAWRAFERFG
jgi:hypothetical protein